MRPGLEGAELTVENPYKIILASASPRRCELLSQIGLTFTVCPSRKEETAKAVGPGELVEELSWQKAADVFEMLTAERIQREGISGAPEIRPAVESVGKERFLVIGADTVVACGKEILGKPAGKEDACRMLEKLQGRSHFVYTGVTVIGQGEPTECFSFHERTRVDFYPMTSEEIEAYVKTGEPMDKAGAYGIQGRCAAFIRGIEGDYNNVVGLPVGRLYQEMHQRNLL